MESKYPIENIDTKTKYDLVVPEMDEWPVVKLSKDRKNFVKEVAEESGNKIKEQVGKSKNALIEELEITMHRERLRIKQNPWKVDPEDEYVFWKKVKSRLVEISTDPQLKGKEEEILQEILHRYSDEIAGNFKKTSYRFAKSAVQFLLARLLNAARIKGFGSFWSKELTLMDKIHITGEIEHIRKLAKKGTIVMVPTHFSNLDSILIGWVISALGLPPFIYGAGLNLFNISLFAYFMNSLGAYKVDRRKKNAIYLETLKTYSSKALERGCHSLFFPGGTRSRSGKIEDRLKLGLLGSALDAQRNLYENHPNEEKKIFIVPVVINYNFVLEAPNLIRDYLEWKGQERYYVENDEFSKSYKILTFLFKFFTKGSDISVSIGQGRDLLGNPVDDEGNSLDKHGNFINTKEYFMSGGKLVKDKQRDEEYTRMLAETIVKDFHRINRVFASHIAAFTAFEMLKKRHHKLDLYNFLRLPEEEQVISYEDFKKSFEQVRARIYELRASGKIGTSNHLAGNIDEVIKKGVDNVGMYHSKRPLIFNQEGNITTMDLNILYYYRNRLDGYGLEKYI